MTRFNLSEWAVNNRAIVVFLMLVCLVGGLGAYQRLGREEDPDFSIQSRSQTLPVGIDDPARIAELACTLLDRALSDRPGALRLVGVGVSGLDPFRQLQLG